MSLIDLIIKKSILHDHSEFQPIPYVFHIPSVLDPDHWLYKLLKHLLIEFGRFWTLVFNTPMIFVHHDFYFQKFEDSKKRR